MANTAPITLEQLFRFYRGLPHQLAAIAMLEEDIRENSYAVAMRRDRPWFHVWSQAGKQPELPAQPVDGDSWLPLARQIVQEFEGCKLTAYPDPGTGGEPWTIGWGATRIMGRAVKRGETITQGQADAQLEQDLRRFRDGVVSVLPVVRGWPAAQQAALVSFAFNVGIGAIESSTLAKRLRDGEDPEEVIEQELPRWIKGGDKKVLPGLVRRRAAEVALFMGRKAPPGPAQAVTPAPERPKSVLLKVPYFSQNDNASGTGYRECFSSSCAMVAAFWGKVRSDDEYNRIRAGIGDTTLSEVQVATLRKLGLEARLVSNSAPGLLEAELRAGRPVPVGWLHKGQVNAPVGGGHWSVCIGFDADHWIHHDPNGEANLIGGGYVNHTAGNAVRYSRKNWNRRWEADGASTGWALLIKPL